MLVSLILLPFCVAGLQGILARAETIETLEEEQITEEIDEDAEFATDEILIVMDEETSRFGDKDAISLDRTDHGDVVDLTKIGEPSDELTEYY